MRKGGLTLRCFLDPPGGVHVVLCFLLQDPTHCVVVTSTRKQPHGMKNNSDTNTTDDVYRPVPSSKYVREKRKKKKKLKRCFRAAWIHRYRGEIAHDKVLMR